MNMKEKIHNITDEAKGKVKQAFGEVSKDDELEREGKVDQAKANLKQAGEKAKDALP